MIDPDVEDLPKRTKWKLALLITGLLAVTGLGIAAALILLVSNDTHPIQNVPNPTPSPTRVVVQPSPTELTDNEYLFVRVMRERPAFQSESDSKMIETGRAVCVAFDTGAGWQAIFRVIQDSGVSEYDTGWLMQASVETLCPNNLGKLPEE